ALWCGISCYFMDENGFIFAPASNGEQAGFIKYRGLVSGQAVNKTFGEGNFFQSLVNFVAALKSFGLEITSVNILAKDDAEALTSLGFNIKFNPQEIQENNGESDLT